MYKSGQRDLPLEALQQFSVLLQGVQKEKTSKTAQHFIKEAQHKNQRKTKRCVRKHTNQNVSCTKGNKHYRKATDSVFCCA
jgi:hypothetical protein